MAGTNKEVEIPSNCKRKRSVRMDSTSRNNNDNCHQHDGDEDDEVSVRRSLRSKYLAVKNLISGENDDLSTQDSSKFKTIFNEVESLHKQVRKPREQIADAEALLDIASSFVNSVKAHRNEGATPSDLVSCLLRDFGQQDRAPSSSINAARNLILWKDIGLAVSHIFRKGAGCSTMLGPMNAELKIRKSNVRRKRTKPTEMARPEELNNVTDEKTDTDKNMLTMFGVMRKFRKVRLENLVLNRNSFAQTVENLFTLSFLVKDGRAEIAANENGHFVCPRNAPDAKAVESGKVSFGHFVFRFDFRDWKEMLDSVPQGEELMPHRVQVFNVQANPPTYSSIVEDSIPIECSSRVTLAHSGLIEDSVPVKAESTAVTTPVRKRSRNRGIFLPEQALVVDDSSEYPESIRRATNISL